MSKELNELMKPAKNRRIEPDKFYAIGSYVFINEFVIQRRMVAKFINENEAAAYAVSRNKEKAAS